MVQGHWSLGRLSSQGAGPSGSDDHSGSGAGLHGAQGAGLDGAGPSGADDAQPGHAQADDAPADVQDWWSLLDVAREQATSEHVHFKQLAAIDAVESLWARYACEALRDLHETSDRFFIFSVGCFHGHLPLSVFTSRATAVLDPGHVDNDIRVQEVHDPDEEVSFEVMLEGNALPALGHRKMKGGSQIQDVGDTKFFHIVKSHPHLRKLPNNVISFKDRFGLAVAELPVLENYKRSRQVVVASEPHGGATLDNVLFFQPSHLDVETLLKIVVWQVHLYVSYAHMYTHTHIYIYIYIYIYTHIYMFISRYLLTSRIVFLVGHQLI